MKNNSLWYKGVSEVSCELLNIGLWFIRLGIELWLHLGVDGLYLLWLEGLYNEGQELLTLCWLAFFEILKALHLLFLLDSCLERSLLISKSALLSWRDLWVTKSLIFVLKEFHLFVGLLDVLVSFDGISASLFGKF